MEGVHRFLARVWRLFEGGVVDEEPSKEQLRLLHQTIKKVRGPRRKPCCIRSVQRSSLWGQPNCKAPTCGLPLGWWLFDGWAVARLRRQWGRDCEAAPTASPQQRASCHSAPRGLWGKVCQAAVCCQPWCVANHYALCRR